MFSYLSETLNIKNLGELIAPTLTPEQQLHQAISDGLPEKVRHLLDDVKVSVNARTPEGSYPIHSAAYAGRVDIFNLLLERGADITTLGPRGNTPLHLACAQGHFELAKLLVSRGANVAQRNQSARTSYDVAKGDSLRQFLLPLQFQHEDPTERAAAVQQAHQMGLTGFHDPTMPQAAIAPPPTSMPPMGGGYQDAPMANDPHAALYAPPTHSAIPRGTAARRDPKVTRPIVADGFGSSVGNAELTAFYGNTVSINQAVPPPPVMSGPPAHQMTAAPAMAPAPAPRKSIPPQFKIFNPKLAQQNHSQDGSGRPQSAGHQHPEPAASAASFGPSSGPSAFAPQQQPSFGTYHAAPAYNTSSFGHQQQQQQQHAFPPSPDGRYVQEESVDFSAHTSALQ
ncbi:hypothetical protein SPRG_09050 [Saprolegnia parasitica CBS 223.65]|uniref:Uncharacterized protein n=1 Tax=Saprolegnia parasitica (strain CBS 223.65) TaxID=695850 RepID=A0A067CGU4_SAPPC|nr:hypothetical protein SPRG_09050 [Saprolegnia parasitica CBS 223.65]KDO25751.1 hypothetical protein SPRG_09050 [Saprolegnia parasitica CBS 223.65]|eukprot:XP_012203560.1 hypothetical protein SPRG_09050 [Saprolegnia parasitica CBS 223.65]